MVFRNKQRIIFVFVNYLINVEINKLVDSLEKSTCHWEPWFEIWFLLKMEKWSGCLINYYIIRNYSVKMPYYPRFV